MASDLLAIIDAANQRHGLFKPSQMVLVAVSGGRDSLVLLHCLRALQNQLGIRLHAATYDHGWRGAESAADCQHVLEIAAQWQIAASAGRHTGTETHPSEALAREARYAFLAATANQIGAAAIVVGHHAADQAETVLMHIVRGASLAGLRGMQPKTALSEILNQPASDALAKIAVVRPLLMASRDQIDDYAQQHGIAYREDSSNSDLRYRRNYLRQEIMPRLATLNPQVERALLRLADLSNSEYEAVLSQLPPIQQAEGYAAFSRPAMLALPPVWAMLLIRQAVQAAGRPAPDHAQSQQLYAALSAAQVTRFAQFGLWFSHHTRTDQIEIYDPAQPPPTPYLEAALTLKWGQNDQYSLAGGWQVGVYFSGQPAQPPATGEILLMLRAKPHSQIVLRGRQRGDTLQAAGMGGQHSTLKDLMINAKVRPSWRNLLPLVVIDDQVRALVLPSGQIRLAEAEAGEAVWFHFFRAGPTLAPSSP
jgi:tRNA(Ile)-lysidine synthase